MDSLIRNMNTIKTSIVNVCVQLRIEVEYDPLFLINQVFEIQNQTISHSLIKKIAKKNKTTYAKVHEVFTKSPNEKVYFPYIDRLMYHKRAQGFIQTQFIAIRQSTYHPENTSLIFTNGIVMLVGIKGSNIKTAIENNVQKICNILQGPVLISESCVVNIVVSFRLPFHLDFLKLNHILTLHGITYSNNINNFSGFFVKILIPIKPLENNQRLCEFYDQMLPVTHDNYRVITLLLFENGVCSLLGNQSIQDWQIQPRILMGLFIHFSHGPQSIAEGEISQLMSYFNFKPLEWYFLINFFFKQTTSAPVITTTIDSKYSRGILFSSNDYDDDDDGEGGDDVDDDSCLLKDGAMKIVGDDKVVMISKDFATKIVANNPGNPERHCGSYRTRYKEIHDRREFSKSKVIRSICSKLIDKKVCTKKYCCSCEERK